MKLIQTIIAGVLVVGMGSAFADEPVALTETQMDNVSAGGIADAVAQAGASGLLAAATLTQTVTSVTVQHITPTQGGQITQDLAVSLSHSAGVAL